MRQLKANRMLVILTYPGDEYPVKETLLKYADQDIEIILLYAYRRQIGSLIPALVEMNAISKDELLLVENNQALERYDLGLQEGDLARLKTPILYEFFAAWIEVVEPQVILTFCPDCCPRHPDNVTVSHIVTQLVEKYFQKVCLLYIAPPEASGLGNDVFQSRWIQGNLRFPRIYQKIMPRRDTSFKMA